MQFLKILFWCLLAFVAALFTYGNWVSVPIRLWGGLISDVNLPFLLLVTFLLGFLPTFAYQRAVRWRVGQRLANAERTVVELRAIDHPIAIIEPVSPADSPLSVPIAVPPAVV